MTLLDRMRAINDERRMSSREMMGIDMAIKAMRPQPEWQPIDTAPKDGTGVIVCTESRVVGEARFFAKSGRWYWAGSEPGDYWDGSIRSPKHWMPMPDPPK